MSSNMIRLSDHLDEKPITVEEFKELETKREPMSIPAKVLTGFVAFRLGSLIVDDLYVLGSALVALRGGAVFNKDDLEHAKDTFPSYLKFSVSAQAILLAVMHALMWKSGVKMSQLK